MSEPVRFATRNSRRVNAVIQQLSELGSLRHGDVLYHFIGQLEVALETPSFRRGVGGALGLLERSVAFAVGPTAAAPLPPPSSPISKEF